MVKEETSLLTVSQVDLEFDTELSDQHQVRHVARQHFDGLRQAVEYPCARVIARENAFRIQPVSQRTNDNRQQPIRSLRQRLHNQIVAIPIDDEGGKQVGLAVHEPVRVAVDVQRFPKGNRRVDPCRDQRLVRRSLSQGQHPNRDLRLVAVERVANHAASGGSDRDDVAGARVHVADIAAVDPWVSAADALFAAR